MSTAEMYPLPHYGWNALVLCLFVFDDSFIGCVVFCMVVLWEESLLVWVVLWGVEVHWMGVERVWLEVSELGLFPWNRQGMMRWVCRG